MRFGIILRFIFLIAKANSGLLKKKPKINLYENDIITAGFNNKSKLNTLSGI